MAEGVKNGQHGRKRIYQALVFLAVAGFIAFGYWFLFVRGSVYSDDARIDGDLVDIAPRIAGELVQVNFKEGDPVSKGSVVFALDTNLLKASLENAEADVVSAKASLDVAQAQYDKAVNGPLKNEIRIARAQAAKAASAKDLAEITWERVDALFTRHILSAAERDNARTALQTARDTYKEASERLGLLEEGTRSEDLLAARASMDVKKAELQSSRARLSQAKINLAYAHVRAPFSGIVVRRWRDPGATVAAGSPVLTLLDPKTLHVSANIDEKYLNRVAEGDAVEISVDAYPILRLTGRLEKILRATNSQFSLIPAEGVSGTFIKVAQRVPLKISIDSETGLPLGPGLSVEVRIRSGSARTTH